MEVLDVCVINPCPDNLRKYIAKNKRIILLTKVRKKLEKAKNKQAAMAK
jgi:hypothetical protein